MVAPTNLIVYGPPGTGKTHWLRERFKDYTDAPNNVDPESWLQETLTAHGWRSVIAAALADIARPARVPEIRAHRWVHAKAKQRGRAPAGVQATLWGYLQEHTPETSKTVNISSRRPPYLFDKRDAGDWQLIPGWQEQDDESAPALADAEGRSKGGHGSHPPVQGGDFPPLFHLRRFCAWHSASQDRRRWNRLSSAWLTAVFKQICDEAHANPGTAVRACSSMKSIGPTSPRFLAS